MTKPSEIFEGEGSSLREAFDAATGGKRKAVMCSDSDCFNKISNVDLTVNPKEKYCRRCKLRNK